jgi:hypothetical protein
MIELALLAGVAIVVFAGVVVLAAVLKTLLWLVLFPVRLLVHVIFWPLMLLKAILGGLLFVVLGPVLLLALIAVGVAVLTAVAVPLLPLLFAVFVIWAILRATSTTTAIAR